MPILQIPSPLRSYTNGLGEVVVKGHTVSEAMLDFVRIYPNLQPHLYDKNGTLRSYVNLFVNDANVKTLQGLDTPLREGDHLRLIPSIAGG